MQALRLHFSLVPLEKRNTSIGVLGRAVQMSVTLLCSSPKTPCFSQQRAAQLVSCVLLVEGSNPRSDFEFYRSLRPAVGQVSTQLRYPR